MTLQVLKKIFYVPRVGLCEGNTRHKACIMWNAHKILLDLMELNLQGYPLLVEVHFQAFLNVSYKYKTCGHCSCDCLGGKVYQVAEGNKVALANDLNNVSL